MEPAVLIAVAIVAIFAVFGWRDGVVKRLVEVVGAIVAVVLTARFAARVTPWLAARTGWDEGVTLLAAWVLLNHVELLSGEGELLRVAMPLLRLEGVIDAHGKC